MYTFITSISCHSFPHKNERQGDGQSMRSFSLGNLLLKLLNHGLLRLYIITGT